MWWSLAHRCSAVIVIDSIKLRMVVFGFLPIDFSAGFWQFSEELRTACATVAADFSGTLTQQPVRGGG